MNNCDQLPDEMWHLIRSHLVPCDKVSFQRLCRRAHALGPGLLAGPVLMAYDAALSSAEMNFEETLPLSKLKELRQFVIGLDNAGLQLGHVELGFPIKLRRWTAFLPILLIENFGGPGFRFGLWYCKKLWTYRFSDPEAPNRKPGFRKTNSLARLLKYLMTLVRLVN